MRVYILHNKDIRKNYKDIEEMGTIYADTYQKGPKRNQTAWKL